MKECWHCGCRWFMIHIINHGDQLCWIQYDTETSHEWLSEWRH